MKKVPHRKITKRSRKPLKRVALKAWHVPFAAVAAFAVAASLFLFLGMGKTADGSGTNTVLPTTVERATTGNTFTFTFTGAEVMDSGEVRILVPNSSGWSTPQGTSGVAGYTTVTAGGNATIANVLSAADSATGWTEDDADACNTTPPTNGWGLDTTTFKEGTGSITCNNTGSTGPDGGDSFGFDFAAQNWSAYTQAGFWVRSTAAVATGNIQVAIDNATNCGSPIEELSLPSLSANTWTYVKWTFSGAGSTRTSVLSFCFNAQNNTGMDNKQIWVDDVMIGPGSPTFTANGSDTDVAIRLLDLAAGETLTTTYGSGGGTSGVTAPGTAGVYTFTTRTRTSSSGSLTNIASSPTITVTNPVPTTTSISPTTKTVGDSGFTMTVNGTNFVSSSVVRLDGSDRTTTFVNSTQVTASIPSSDLTTAGTFSITVFNPTPGGGTSNAQTFTVNAAAPVATKFVIIDPADSTVGTPTTVTVQAQKADNSVDTAYQTDVTLVASGSATGEGLVNIANGVGTLDINDSVAETVTLSLSDSQGTGLDVTSTQQVIFSPAGTTPTPEEEEVDRTTVLFTDVHLAGRAFPGAKIILVSRQAATETLLQQENVTSASGDFDLSFTGEFSGLYTYGLRVFDSENRSSQTKFYTFDVNLGALVQLDILVPPTIGFLRPTVRKGDVLGVIGYATPGSVVTMQIDGRPLGRDFPVAADGYYKALVNTAELAYDRHTARVRQTDGRGRTSDFSLTKVFEVSRLFFPRTDLNSDGIINISDWSIFLSRWGSKDPDQRKLIDFNGDGKVDISDFSIFIRTVRIFR